MNTRAVTKATRSKAYRESTISFAKPTRYFFEGEGECSFFKPQMTQMNADTMQGGVEEQNGLKLPLTSRRKGS
jgi:hypothetical protein